jgi:hypothetical protein
MTILYVLAAFALLSSTAAVYMALIKPFPVQWLYYHYFVRKPLVWTILGGSLLWTVWHSVVTGAFPWSAAVPLALTAMAVVLTYRMHQESVFPAIDYPTTAAEPLQLPLTDEMQLAVIEHGGVTRAYPLDYVIHHHIVNDRFGDCIVALTYCAMCRSIIPFDVTDIGPMFVGSFKNANMIVADRRTKTFFQQATFQSIIGPLHPHALTMIPFQILPWGEVKRLAEIPQVVRITRDDLREFRLPIPGAWRKIMASETTPGLPARLRDKSFPSRTRVIGVIDSDASLRVAYLKHELTNLKLVKNEALDAYFVAVGDTVNAFKGCIAGRSLELTSDEAGALSDTRSGTTWDARGKYRCGPIRSDLEALAISDEYWFSWKAFHPDSELVRLS